MVDEMYIQKGTQYQAGEYVGGDENGDLYKGVVVFMVVGLKKSIPYVVQAVPEVKISGEWLAPRIAGCIDSLGKVGFVVRAVCTDNHSSNVNAFHRLKKEYCCGEDEVSIFHPSNHSKKTYLFFDSVHLMKNIRNNLVAAKKFVFPRFDFENSNFHIQCPAGYISWSDIHKIYDRDMEQQANLKKARKLSFKSLHPGNNKQSVPLALAIFDETTIAAAEAYFPSQKDLVGFLTVVSTWWKISNSKEPYDPNPLGNAVVPGDGKIEFLRYLASWIEGWSESPYFTLTPHTSLALTTTLSAHCHLITELLADGYDFVMTGRLQSDQVERRISRYRQMSGGRFLVSLREVLNSERILACRSLIKEGINFWEEDEDLRPDIDTASSTCNESLAISDLRARSTEIMECFLNETSAEVATTIAGYVSKKLKERTKCDACHILLSSNKLDLENNHYLNLLSRGGLTVPSAAVAEYTCSCFAIIDFASNILQKYTVLNVQRVLNVVLREFAPKVKFTCSLHDEWGQTFSTKIMINIFYNNKQNVSTDSSRKDCLAAFKTRQRGKV